MNTKREQQSSPPIQMLRFIGDIPNVITLTGLLCAIAAIYWAIIEIYPASMIALLWASFCDWFDGPVAKKMSSRPKAFQHFGAQLDSFADIISSGIAPAIILLSIGEWSAWYLPGAMIIITAGVIRLSYFNVYGLGDDGCYQGIPIPANVVLVTSLFLAHDLVEIQIFQILLYASILFMATLNVAPFRFPKLTGGWYISITFYTVFLTIYFVWRLSLL